MIKKAGLGVSYNGKKVLEKEANIHFKTTNLLGLLYAQGYSDNQIISWFFILTPMQQIYCHFQPLLIIIRPFSSVLEHS